MKAWYLMCAALLAVLSVAACATGGTESVDSTARSGQSTGNNFPRAGGDGY